MPQLPVLGILMRYFISRTYRRWVRMDREPEFAPRVALVAERMVRTAMGVECGTATEREQVNKRSQRSMHGLLTESDTQHGKIEISGRLVPPNCSCVRTSISRSVSIRLSNCLMGAQVHIFFSRKNRLATGRSLPFLEVEVERRP